MTGTTGRRAVFDPEGADLDRTAERDACAFAAEVLEDLASPVLPPVTLRGGY